MDPQAYQNNDVVSPGTNAGISAASVAFSASDTSSITANVGAASLAIAVSGGASVSVSIGLSLATNTIDNDVKAYLANATTVTTTSTTVGISVMSEENATIHATSTAASVAAAGGLVGVGIAGAGAEATNVINGTDNAYVCGSGLTSAVGVSVTTTDTSNIQATITTAAAGVGVGVLGVGALIGAAVAENFVGYNSDGSPGSLQVEACVDDSSINAAQALTLTATSGQTIDAKVVAGSVAIGGGLVGLAASGAGVYTENRIGATVWADIDGDGSTTGITANAVTVTATDQSSITATAASVAVAFSLAPVGVSVAAAVTIASNTISNDVEAYIKDATAPVVTTQSGDLDVEASETASITATAAAAASAVAAGSWFSAAFSLADVNSTNAITSQVSAFIASSTNVAAAGAVQVSAGNTPTVSDTIVAVSLAGGLYGIAFGLSQAQDMEEETVAAYIDGSTVQAQGGNLEVMATSNPSITTTNVATAITVAIGAAAAAAESNLTIDTTTQAYVNKATLTAGDANNEYKYDVIVKAISTSTAAPTVTSVAGGYVAFAGLTSEAKIDGTTEAYACGTTTASAAAFDIGAKANNTATEDSNVAAVGLIGVGILSLTATDTPTVQAYLGAGSNVQNNQGGITVDATSSDEVTAQAQGVSAGLVAIGANDATATMTPTVSAWIGSGATVTSTGAVTVEATAMTTNGALASGDLKAVSAGDVESGTIMATAGAQVTSDIGSGATVLAAGIVTVTAAGTNLVEATADVLSIGILLNMTGIAATATDNGADSAYVGAPAGTTGAGAVVGTATQPDGGLDVQATGADSSTANVDLSGGGAFSDSSANATATTSPTLNAYVSSGSMVNVTGNVTVQSTSTTGGNATTKGSSGGILTVSGSQATTTVTPTINTYIATSSGASGLEVSPQDISSSIITPNPYPTPFTNGEPVGYSLAGGDRHRRTDARNHLLRDQRHGDQLPTGDPGQHHPHHPHHDQRHGRTVLHTWDDHRGGRQHHREFELRCAAGPGVRRLLHAIPGQWQPDQLPAQHRTRDRLYRHLRPERQLEQSRPHRSAPLSRHRGELDRGGAWCGLRRRHRRQ